MSSKCFEFSHNRLGLLQCVEQILILMKTHDSHGRRNWCLLEHRLVLFGCCVGGWIHNTLKNDHVHYTPKLWAHIQCCAEHNDYLNRSASFEGHRTTARCVKSSFCIAFSEEKLFFAWRLQRVWRVDLCGKPEAKKPSLVYNERVA